MKISQIRITDFHQFKDLTIDLTYPKGHEKEGKPLDKVCADSELQPIAPTSSPTIGNTLLY